MDPNNTIPPTTPAAAANLCPHCLALIGTPHKEGCPDGPSLVGMPRDDGLVMGVAQ